MAWRAVLKTETKVITVPTRSATANVVQEMVRWRGLTLSMMPRWITGTAMAAPMIAPATDPVSPVNRAVRSTEPMIWLRLAPTQRSSPI